MCVILTSILNMSVNSIFLLECLWDLFLYLSNLPGLLLQFLVFFMIQLPKEIHLRFLKSQKITYDISSKVQDLRVSPCGPILTLRCRWDKPRNFDEVVRFLQIVLLGQIESIVIGLWHLDLLKGAGGVLVLLLGVYRQVDTAILLH